MVRPYRAFALVAPALAWLAACGPGEPAKVSPPEERVADAASGPLPWFICDGIDSPLIFAAKRIAGGRALITLYDKSTGLPLTRAEYETGAATAALGAVDTPLVREGAQAGFVRSLDQAMLGGSAYTPPVIEAAVGERRAACRWLPRTRFAGFSERRSWAVHEDQDGDLIYLSFDYLDPNRATPIDLSDEGRSTPFSLEVRGGSESVGPQGAQFRFENDGYAYVIDAPNAGPGTVTVTQGEALVQRETLLDFQIGQAR